MPLASEAADISLPRVLCLHGGGVNAKVFELQLRVVAARLRNTFRLVFLDAPFPCAPHESLITVYGDCGPFYRWLRWLDDHDEMSGSEAAKQIVGSVQKAMSADQGSGPWVGILGFSQGAKIAASLLWAQERMRQTQPAEQPLTDFKFGVIMAGSAPLVLLDPRLQQPKHVVDAGQDASTFDDFPEKPVGDHVLSIPTLHVHGLQDPGLWKHHLLRDRYCKEGTARVVEWDGGHRLPIKTPDVTAIVTEILEVAQDAGVL